MRRSPRSRPPCALHFIIKSYALLYIIFQIAGGCSFLYCITLIVSNIHRCTIVVILYSYMLPAHDHIALNNRETKYTYIHRTREYHRRCQLCDPKRFFLDCCLLSHLHIYIYIIFACVTERKAGKEGRTDRRIDRKKDRGENRPLI